MITSLITLNYTTRSPIVNCENLRTGIFIKVQSSNHISLQLLKQKHGLQLIGLWSSNCMNVLKYLFNFNQIEGVQIPDCFNCFFKLKFNTIYSNREREKEKKGSMVQEKIQFVQRILQFFVCNHVTRRPCWGSIQQNFSRRICIGNSMICSDVWHKYHG